MPETSVPMAIEAEQAVLGALLYDCDAWWRVCDGLSPEAFARDAHGRLYRLLGELAEQGQRWDTLTVTQRILAEPEPYGGVGYLTSLPERCPSVESLEGYAHLVADKARRRELLRAAAQLQEGLHEAPDLGPVVEAAEQALLDVGGQGQRGAWRRVGDSLEHELEEVKHAGEKRGVTGLSTGFVDLDRILAGWQPSDLVILAARPAMGKTALALNCARAAARAGVGVGVLSLEMPHGQLTRRLLCAESRVDASKLRTGQLSRLEDWPALLDAGERLHQELLFIDDTPALTVMQVRSKARRLKAECPNLGLLVVDYLQLMQGSGGPREVREQVIASISRGLKALAKELEIPVVALSQLNRGVEARSNKRPMLADLRESGAIEQDADIILFIYRDEYYNKNTTDVGVAEVIVAKHRNGPTGTVRLYFAPQYGRFDNLSDSQEYV